MEDKRMNERKGFLEIPTQNIKSQSEKKTDFIKK